MVFHGVEADSAASRDGRIAQPVPHGLDHGPLGGREHIGGRRTATGSFHLATIPSRRRNFPTPRRMPAPPLPRWCPGAPLGGGKYLMDRLAERVAQAGVQVRYDSRVVALVAGPDDRVR